MLMLLPSKRHLGQISPQIRGQSRMEKVIMRFPGLLIAQELAISSLFSNAVAFAVAGMYGWGNPFANTSTKSSVEAFTLCMVWNCTFFGGLASDLLVSFVFRGRPNGPVPQRSVWSCFWLTVRLSRKYILANSMLAVVSTAVLIHLRVPVIDYNIHSIIGLIGVISALVLTFMKAVHIVRRSAIRRNSQAASIATVHPVPPLQHQRSSIRVAAAWKRTAAKLSCVVLPTAGVSIVAAECILLARKFELHTPQSYFRFCVAMTFVKIALPMMVKSSVLRNQKPNLRNTFSMLVGSIMHVEIQMRMAVRKASAGSIAIYQSSALVNVMEILVRGVIVAIEMTLVRMAKSRLEARKQRAIDDARTDPKANPQELQDLLSKLDASHAKWRDHHLRVCAIEIYAEMASEYCSIGLVSIFMLVLQWNESIDMPAARATTALGLYVEQLSAWGTQVAFEVVTDTIATAVEIRAGIPLVETLREDRDNFMRWVIVVISAHAGGLCIASLITFRSH